VALEHELVREIHKQQQQFSYQVKNGKVAFKAAIVQVHKKLKIGVIPWLLGSQWRNLISIPFIYSLSIPFMLLDICLFIYQSICFRLYRIPRVKRRDYFLFDRHHLKYLNFIQRFNCFYCSYVSGLIAFAREISARSEQYWCPIKHARKIRHPHSRYISFTAYGDGENFAAEAKKLREDITRNR
jgi:hypothetical protein